MKILRLLFGLLLFSTSLTLLYLTMRSVLDIGGFCAEGGPYVIEDHCPAGVAMFAPLSIFGMLIGGGIYALTTVKNSPFWTFLFWSALFVSLGWNFLDFALNGPEGIVISWMVCAVLFGIIGIGPLVFMRRHGLKKVFLGETFPDSAGMLLLHIAAAAGGIVLGLYFFGMVA
jgi:hypothetical protein